MFGKPAGIAVRAPEGHGRPVAGEASRKLCAPLGHNSHARPSITVVIRAPEVLAVVNYAAYGVLLEHALSALNVSIRLSSTATDARRYLQDHSPSDPSDVVLLDFTHLRDSGLELLRRIRSERGLRSTQVVVLSGRDDASDINRAYEWGIEGYVGKSARLRELVMTVSGVLTAPLKK